MPDSVPPEDLEVRPPGPGHPGAPDAAAKPVPEINFDEQFYPARPRALRPMARRRQFVPGPGPRSAPEGTNREYVQWLREQ
ncbi:maltose alpha-D-glucosyltransferase, partial [Arthrobacter deserti]|nr:maltose alpha-D-glucosyltransferase [Arthrobacter deserti]